MRDAASAAVILQRVLDEVPPELSPLYNSKNIHLLGVEQLDDDDDDDDYFK